MLCSATHKRARALIDFWRQVFQIQGNGHRTPIIGLNSWPGEYQSALAITLNSSGNEKSFAAVLDSLIDNGCHVTVFLHGHVTDSVRSALSNRPEIEIASGGYDIEIFPDAGFESVRDDFF